ncbi:hypothetical protein [Longitalea luteola]|uniref:hypothetical protein n=1 Tax=Longitalea luteola TaxID=2812563 RepID=UPI001A9630D6|nr:hypothetical protein [Longitalea luteola]
MNTRDNQKDKQNNKNITGDKQSDFAGTNTDRYGDPKPAEEQDNPIQDQEAQNVKDGDRMTGKEAEHAKNKATEGIRQNRDE